MSKWKSLFEIATADCDQVKPNVEWRFGAPATPDEFDRLRSHLGGQIPPTLRELLSDFNGIQTLDPHWGPDWRPLYFTVNEILTDVVDYLETSGNPTPPPEELASVAFFAHQNGLSALYAVCVRDFASFSAGNVVYLDNESGEFELHDETLEDFVRHPDHCRL